MEIPTRRFFPSINSHSRTAHALDLVQESEMLDDTHLLTHSALFRQIADAIAHRVIQAKRPF